jgi:hypothetical protein
MARVQAETALTGLLKNGSKAKPDLFERFELRWSTGRDIDGVWIGTFDTEAGLRRVEGALQLMKRQSPLHHGRVVHSLDRIWVRLVPDSVANYSRRLNACELDERFVVANDTTLELIASTIVHEATHARLEGWGIAYDEARRHRIEAICLRRELDFVSQLTGCEALQESVRRSLDYYGNNSEFFSDGNMGQRFEDGSFETLRYLGVPNWLVALLARIAKLRRRRSRATTKAPVTS